MISILGSASSRIISQSAPATIREPQASKLFLFFLEKLLQNVCPAMNSPAPQNVETKDPNSRGRAFACEFCGNSFATKSTYGRHLDSKKGDVRHLAEKVEAIRGGVVRRAARPKEGPQNSKDPRSMSEGKMKNKEEGKEEGGKKEEEEGKKDGDEKNETNEKVHEITEKQESQQSRKKLKKNKGEISKAYNSKPAVKEKNKARRRDRDMRIKAQLKAAEWYVSTLTQAQGQSTSERFNSKMNKNLYENTMEKAEGSTEKTTITCSFPDSEINLSDAAVYAYTVASNVPPSLWPPTGRYLGDKEFSITVGQLSGTNRIGTGSEAMGESGLNSAPENGPDNGPGSGLGSGLKKGLEKRLEKGLQSFDNRAARPDMPRATALESVFACHAQWEKLDSAQKLALWLRESDRALRTHLEGVSLSHISEAAVLVAEKQRSLYNSYKESDFLSALLTDSAPEA